MEDESRIPSADVPNLEATTTVNTVIGTMVCCSSQTKEYLTTQVVFLVFSDLLA